MPLLAEDTIKRIATHGAIHTAGLCRCPCYDALLKIGEQLADIRGEAATSGALAAHLTAAGMDPEDAVKYAFSSPSGDSTPLPEGEGGP